MAKRTVPPPVKTKVDTKADPMLHKPHNPANKLPADTRHRNGRRGLK